MADIRVVISALNNASGSIAKVKADIKNLGEEGKKAGGGVKGLGASLGSVWTTALAAAGAIAAVAGAIKVAYNAAKEGAQLEYAAGKFDRLAEAAGTTSGVLLGDLKDATRGLVSDAELMGSAADFMALGLAKSHDEVVRLTYVAGALGMNMNQLVLTLTNQTTMRFDALGVSVDGFSEKVKALEAAGMSANDAFKEAFLQQAEEQIRKVGNIADTAAGQFAAMEAAQANYFNQMKQDLMEAGSWWAQFWTKVYNDKYDVRAYNDLIEQAKNLGIDTMPVQEKVQGYTGGSARGYSYSYLNAADAEGIRQNQELVEALAEQVDYQSKMNVMRNRGTNANYEYSASEKLVADSIAYVRSEFQQQADKITTLDSTYKGIIDLGYKYSDTLAEINAKQAEYDAMPGWKQASEDGKQLLSDIEALKGSMTDLANQVTLDMFQATIAVGGVTEAELAAYMQMAIDMGYMSEEGAKAALDAYGNAIKTINGYELDEKTGNITFDAQQAFDVITMINAMEIADKNGNIDIFVRYHNSGSDNYWEDRAVGGPVTSGQEYNWQEYGYRGEVFVPSADGFVLSRADAERALAKALYGGGSAIDPAAIGKAVAQAMSGVTAKGKGGNVYNLTMPTSSNPADVRTAFELMEAWA